MSTAEQRARRLDPGPLITLYDLDLTKLGGPVLHYHDTTDIGDRTFKDGQSTDNSTTYNSESANFVVSDVGKYVTGKYIQPNTVIQSWNENTIILSNPATGTGSSLPFTIVLRVDPVITWKGNQYNPYPIKAEEYEWSTRGTLPRPKLSVSNVGSTISALMRTYGDFVGCKVTRTRTFAAFVKAGNVEGEEYDPACTQHFPIEMFLVERKSMETSAICSFELSMAMDAQGVMLPRRQILAHTCIWGYRDGDCGYTGVPKTNREGDAFNLAGAAHGDWETLQAHAFIAGDWCYTVGFRDVKTYWVCKVGNTGIDPRTDLNEAHWMQDMCLKKYSDCETHFGVNNPLRTSAFPACYKIR